MLKFIVAGSLRDAVTTAVIDWNWQRIEQTKFRMTSGWRLDGNVVQYLDRFERLYGIRDTTIYLGYRWNENPEWENAYMFLNMQRHRILRGP